MSNELGDQKKPFVTRTSINKQNERGKSLGIWLFVVLGIGSIYLSVTLNNIIYAIIGLLLSFLLANSIKIAHEWQRALVLRMGRFHKLAGPGPFFCIPIVDHVTVWIDQRIRTSYFEAEKTLTMDNVPVNVDAVMFWVVWDCQKAALEVEDYEGAVSWAAQTALRDIIGKTELSEMLAGRERLDAELQAMIDERTEEWGITVRSVEIRDVVIPSNLQDVMSREAQAERERRSRNILGQAEKEIADAFVAAARKYEESDRAFDLRAMNILYESVKDTGGIVVVPSGFNDSSFGTMAGMAHYGKLSHKNISPDEK